MAQRKFDDARRVLLGQWVRLDNSSIKMFRGDASKDFVVIASDNRLKALPSKSKRACCDCDIIFGGLRNFAIEVHGSHERQAPQMRDNLLQEL